MYRCNLCPYIASRERIEGEHAEWHHPNDIVRAKVLELRVEGNPRKPVLEKLRKKPGPKPGTKRGSKKGGPKKGEPFAGSIRTLCWGIDG